MCTNIFVWLLKILCQTFIAFDQNKIIYDKKSSMMDKFIQQATVFAKIILIGQEF